MAGLAFLVGVQADGGHAALRLIVTSQARGRRARLLAERVAVLARRHRRTAMQRRRHGGMTRLAQPRGRRRKRIAVAVGARHLAEVRGVPGAVAHLAVRGGHLTRRSRLAARAARCDRDRCDGEPPDHGFDPIEWHIRHGSAVSGSRLDQPAGCGVPPTPPTLWQPTHSDWPAPS